MQLNEVIKELGEVIGFESLEINENGVVHLTIDNIGDLFIDIKYRDESGDFIFIYLLRVYERVDGDLYKRALDLCDYQRNAEFLVNPVSHKEQALGFAIKYPIETLTFDKLRKIIRTLQELQDRLEGETLK